MAMKLLIVEDEVKLARYLCKGLTEEGYVVDVAHNGIDGLHMVTQSDYDGLIVDGMLPGIDGTKVTELLNLLHAQFALGGASLAILSSIILSQKFGQNFCTNLREDASCVHSLAVYCRASGRSAGAADHTTQRRHRAAPRLWRGPRALHLAASSSLRWTKDPSAKTSSASCSGIDQTTFGTCAVGLRIAQKSSTSSCRRASSHSSVGADRKLTHV